MGTQTYAGHTYSNGRVPAAILAPLAGQPDAVLRADAAASWNRAAADVLARTGIRLTVRGWNRTLGEQERYFLERYEPRSVGTGPYGDVRRYQGRRYVRVRGAAAAIPGTSNHGWGLAVDVDDFGGVGDFTNPRRAKAFPILAQHGWTDTEGRGTIREPWHLVYASTADQHPATPTPTQPAPAATTPDTLEDLMGYPFIIRANANDGWTLVLSPTQQVSVPKLATQERADLVALAGEPRSVGTDLAQRIRATVK